MAVSLFSLTRQNEKGELCVEAMTSEEIISASILYAEETGG
jgi:hypothetical protein